MTKELVTQDNYIANAIRTDLTRENYLVGPCNRLSNVSSTRILHGVMGVTTEAGELMDAVKKHLIYGKALDAVNLKEEMGDVLWYLAILCHELDTNFESLMQTNIKKLSARFPDKFTEHHAQNRDLVMERKILEEGVSDAIIPS